MDHDIRKMTREDMQIEIMKLRIAIRRDRDAQGHDLCHWRPELWQVLPEGYDDYVDCKVPSFWSFLWRCFWFRWNINKNGCCSG